MIYFIAWCVFLGGVILSVPIVSVMGNRPQKAAEPAAETSEEPVEGEVEEVVEETPEVAESDEPMAEFEELQ